MKLCLSKLVSLACVYPAIITTNVHAAISSLTYHGHDKKMIFNQDNIIIIDFEKLDKIYLHLHVGLKPNENFIENLKKTTQSLDPKLKNLALFSNANEDKEKFRIIIGPVPLDKISNYSKHYKDLGYDNFPIFYSDFSDQRITKSQTATNAKKINQNKENTKKSTKSSTNPAQKKPITPEKNKIEQISLTNLIVDFEKPESKTISHAKQIKKSNKKTIHEKKQSSAALTDFKSATENKELNNASSEENKNFLANETKQYIEKNVTNFLSQYGTAKVELGITSNLTVESAEVSYLYHFNVEKNESDTSAFFLQTNMTLNNAYNYHGRIFMNIGLGYRSLSENTLLGMNTFLDSSFTQEHKRMSIGAEYITSYVSFHTNYYFPLSDWKKSRDITAGNNIVLPWESRPANGFDTHIEGHLPSIPWVYLDFNYQRYFGEWGEIRTDKDPIEDPYTISSSINFQPVPLITMSAGYQKEEGGQEGATLGVDMNYRLGVPIDRQLDPSQVSAAKSLNMSLFEFVERDNNMRMEYHEPTKPTVQFNLSKATVIEGTKVDLANWVKLYGNIKDIADAGFIGNASNHIKSRRYFVAPAHDPASKNQYKLSLSLRLKDGSSVSVPFPITITIKKK